MSQNRGFLWRRGGTEKEANGARMRTENGTSKTRRTTGCRSETSLFLFSGFVSSSLCGSSSSPFRDERCTARGRRGEHRIPTKRRSHPTGTDGVRGTLGRRLTDSLVLLSMSRPPTSRYAARTRLAEFCKNCRYSPPDRSPADWRVPVDALCRLTGERVRCLSPACGARSERTRIGPFSGEVRRSRGRQGCGVPGVTQMSPPNWRRMGRRFTARAADTKSRRSTPPPSIPRPAAPGNCWNAGLAKNGSLHLPPQVKRQRPRTSPPLQPQPQLRSAIRRPLRSRHRWVNLKAQIPLPRVPLARDRSLLRRVPSRPPRS